MLTALCLLLVANGLPILAKRLLGCRLAAPVDAGARFVDGRPIFGRSKTWRGLVVGTGASALAGEILAIGWEHGALFGAASLAGDLLSSFTKRRLGIAPSGQAIGIDQIPEALLPLLLLGGSLGLDAVGIGITVALFTVGELVLSRLMFRLGVRDEPY